MSNLSEIEAPAELRKSSAPPQSQNSGEVFALEHSLTVAEMPADLETYRNDVQLLADKKDKLDFLNSGAAHASIVMANIFRTSSEKLRMFARDLNGDVSNNPDYLKHLEDVLSRQVELFLLLEHNPSKHSSAFPLIKRFSEENSNKVHIRFIPKPLEKLIKDLKLNFTVGDSSKYRLEHDTTKYTATCSFNNPKMAKNLIKIFDGFFDVGIPNKN